ncbi:sigma-54 dependent transcriptional regulator [Pelomonas sp. APW6]|uniref:Sigma-54 dependent transcriptional regulator n=1 Tax=Roseateles subflavus TaxID=3053353 RepID=A0ABT7LFW1_9BURK|nr:sigma-54 dependent transcriptional regulator [Pelomonas sp. APW6]MDL5031739.1 sigma-54 dependent transcriptional regulator [Pelomonas sp. APW6]
MERVLTLPQSPSAPLSIRAKALVFHDPASLQLLAQVERVACSDATALIIGETGTGKELVARHLHHCSGRHGPFVAVNCGAFSESLIDAELFGHESGAYTGATGARAGWFEAANGGTLFLDEIGDLPLALQVKLLRVLQERQVVRLGSRKAIPLDVRLVAATNIDLARAVEAQHFRADLYYRLSVATLVLPALRQRPGDILPLAQHFIHQYCQRQGRPDVPLSPAAATALVHYSWPGNIRELENVIHYALIVARGAQVELDDLRMSPLGQGAGAVGSGWIAADAGPHDARAGGADLATASTAADALQRLADAFRDLLDDGRPALYEAVEAALIRTAFAHAQSNQVQTARELGVTRNTVRTLLKRHGLIPQNGAGVVSGWPDTGRHEDRAAGWR